jgi:hypothetical protein
VNRVNSEVYENEDAFLFEMDGGRYFCNGNGLG